MFLPMDELFHFEWAVDQHGYEPVSAEELPAGVERPVLGEPPINGGWWIRRKGGPLRWYRPLESRRGLARGLARRFAYLSKEPQAILKFANQFGFLGVGQTGFEEDVIEEHVWFWRQHMDFMRGVQPTKRDRRWLEAKNISLPKADQAAAKPGTAAVL